MQPVSAVSSPEAVVVALIDSSSTLLVTKDYTLAPEVQRKKETDAGRLTGLIIHRRRINRLRIVIAPVFIITAIAMPVMLITIAIMIAPTVIATLVVPVVSKGRQD